LGEVEACLLRRGGGFSDKLGDAVFGRGEEERDRSLRGRRELGGKTTAGDAP